MLVVDIFVDDRMILYVVVVLEVFELVSID